MAIRSAIVILFAVVCNHPGTRGEIPQLDAYDGHTYCAYVDKQVARPEDGKLLIGENTQEESDYRHLLYNNTVERCIDDSHQCIAFWYVDPDVKDSITILKQGCWNNERQHCGRAECISDRGLDTKSISNITRWCCCHGNMCNVNVTDVWVPGLVVGDEEDGSVLIERNGQHYETKVYDFNKRLRDILMPLGAVTLLSVIIVCVYIVVRPHCARRGGDLGALPLSEPLSSSQGSCVNQFGYAALDGLKLNTVISSGRYGEVWKGALNDITVAVKVIRAGNRSMYVNERDILGLPLMDPKHVPVFYGFEEKVTLDGMPEYLLVSQFIELGMLQTYLKNNVLRWSQMCEILHSIAAGLTFLHTEIRRGDKVKPSIAHRDLNSRNILVNSDLNCVICDYGFAMKLDRHRSEELGEQPTLSDVGTIRYMAPEVLDGAVNLRECETSLKQIDIYSLGLVFWEVGMRCSDLYQGLPVPEYMLPFQTDVGVHPSFEEMQDFVSREKRRPLFPDVWKSTNSAIRALKETIEDCWDQDGEARLTSHCVEERVVEMAALWEARQKGVTPTVNQTATLGTVGLEGRKTEPCNLPPPVTTTASSYHYPSSRGASVSSSEGSSYPRYSALENSISEATTETMMLSPTDSDVVTPPPPATSSSATNTTHPQQPPVAPPHNQTAHNLMYYPKQSRQLAPHQGLNPTVARNTHKSSDEDMSVRGNTLIVPKRGGTGTGGNVNGSMSGSGGSGGDVSSPLLTEALIDAIEENLVRHDILVQNNTDNNRPSSYHENEVASEPLMVTQPKQPNLPQPGTSSPKFKSLFGRLRGKNKPEKQQPQSSASSSGSRFSLPFFNRNLTEKSQEAAAASGSSDENMDNLVDIRPGSGHYRTRSSEGDLVRQQKSNLNRRPPSQQGGVPTEVRMVHGMPVVQPSTSGPRSPPPGVDTAPQGDSARRPNSLFLNGGHNYPRPLPPANQGGGAIEEPPTGAPAPVGLPVYNEMPAIPAAGQPVYNEMPAIPAAGQPVYNEMPAIPAAGQPVYNEMPAIPAAGQPVYNEMPAIPVGQPMYNEMPANPPVYNPVNLSVNVVPGGAVNDGGDVGGAFSLGSDSGPPPNVDLPRDLISNNLQRVYVPSSNVAPPTFGPPPVMATIHDLAPPPMQINMEESSDGEGQRC